MTAAIRLAAAAMALAAMHAAAYSASYQPASLPHQTGAVFNVTEWQVNVDDPANAFMTFGPYATDAPPNTDLLVTFTLAIDNNVADDVEVVRLDVHDATRDAVLTSNVIHRRDFEAAFPAQQDFVLFFTTPAAANTSLEYRVFYICCAEVTHVATAVRSLVDTSPMAAFWEGAAAGAVHFAFQSAHQFPSADGEYAMNVGFMFVTRPEAWYLFHREYSFGPAPTYCTADYARLRVRSSVDGGTTWSNGSVIASPVAGTPYECALVDGGAYFDSVGVQWLYLSQCLDRTDTWAMCLFTRAGVDPLGPFTAAPQQPSVAGGQLWSLICSGADKHCMPSMSEEGTPDIIGRDAEAFYYVTFHGWDPAHGKSARGAAKTRDFVTWLVTGAGLPGDAMFSSLDCNSWNISWASGGCVGGGEGSIYRGNGSDYMYQLIEAPDITLGCLTQPGQQNWVLGLSRAPALLPTGQWAPFVIVPTVVPAIKQGCYIQYHRIFEDVATGSMHLSYWAGNYLQIFTLMPGAGPLPIIAGPPPSHAGE